MKESRLGRKYGLIPSPEDTRDFLARDIGYQLVDLPDEWELRPTAPVRDQGQQGGCTGFAGCALMDHRWLRNGHIFAPGDLYWNELDLEGNVGTDSGAMIRDCMKALQRRGVCLEKDDPYTELAYKTAPSVQAVSGALGFSIRTYHRLHTWDDMRAAIHAGNPVDIGFTVYESFESDEVAKTGIVPMPKWGEEKLGGHSVAVFGYNTEYAIVKNSWGLDWGDKGWFYLPKKFFTMSRVSDLWIIQGV